jgi:fatty acid desaturase
MTATHAGIGRDLRKALLDAVGPEEVRSLQEKSLVRSIGWLVVVWAGVTLTWFAGHWSITAAQWTIPLVVPLCMLYVGTRIHALSVQIHEGSHYLLASSRRVSDLVTNLGAGWWILNSVEEYRRVHNLHHKHLHEAEDPDGPLYLGEMSAARLRDDLFRDLTGRTALHRGRTYVDVGEDGPGLAAWIPKIGANAVLWVGWMLVAGFWVGSIAYALFWAVPLLTIFPALTRLRLLGEHHSGRRDGRARFVARTTECGPLSRHLVGGRMEFHFEHHLLPGIPYRNLRVLHRRLADTGFFDRTDGHECEISSPGYVTFWRARLLERSPQPTPTKTDATAGHAAPDQRERSGQAV